MPPQTLTLMAKTKTNVAVTIDTLIHEEAEKTRKKLNRSRSNYYETAVIELNKKHKKL